MPKGGSGGGTTTTNTTATPWSGVQPYLSNAYQQLQHLYQYGGGTASGTPAQSVPQYYPASTVNRMSDWTMDALQSQAQRGAAGSPLVDAAQAGLKTFVNGTQAGNLNPTTNLQQRLDRDTLAGNYLKAGNPYLQGAIKAATDPVRAEVDSMFTGAGRYGSGAHAGQVADAIGDISSNMAFGAYQTERGLQDQAAARAQGNYNSAMDRWMNASALAPTLANQDYLDINQMGAAGSGLDAYNQAVRDADIERWNYNQDADWRRTQDLIGTLMGAPFGQSSTTQMPRQNAFTSALGGASTGAALGSIFGPWGTGIGALLGGGLSLF